MRLIQDWALLDGTRRSLSRHGMLDNCRTLAPGGKAGTTPALLVRRCETLQGLSHDHKGLVWAWWGLRFTGFVMELHLLH